MAAGYPLVRQLLGPRWDELERALTRINMRGAHAVLRNGVELARRGMGARKKVRKRGINSELARCPRVERRRCARGFLA